MTARTLRQNGVDCDIWHCPDCRELTLRLRRAQPRERRPITHVVINTPGFVRPEEYGEFATMWPRVQFVMLNHTGLAYQSIDPGGWANIRKLLDIQSMLDNVMVAGNNLRFCNSIMAAFGKPTVLLPNLFDLEQFRPLPPQRRAYGTLRIGSFLPKAGRGSQSTDRRPRRRWPSPGRSASSGLNSTLNDEHPHDNSWTGSASCGHGKRCMRASRGRPWSRRAGNRGAPSLRPSS